MINFTYILMEEDIDNRNIMESCIKYIHLNNEWLNLCYSSDKRNAHDLSALPESAIIWSTMNYLKK